MPTMPWASRMRACWDWRCERGRVLLIAVNKWDGIAPEQREEIRRQLALKLDFVPFAPLHFISARHGTGVGRAGARCGARLRRRDARDADAGAHAHAGARASQAHQPPLVHGRRIKLRYAHQGGRNPPRIVIHGNQTGVGARSLSALPGQCVRKRFDLYATPGGDRVSQRRQSLRPAQGGEGDGRGGGKNNAGSTKTRLSATPKCRCGPVTRPVAPTAPITRAGVHLLARLHPDRRQVAVHRDQTLAVVEQHGVAVEEVVAGVDHRPSAAACTGVPVRRRCPCRCADCAAAPLKTRREPNELERTPCDRRAQPQRRRRLRSTKVASAACRCVCSRAHALQILLATDRPLTAAP